MTRLEIIESIFFINPDTAQGTVAVGWHAPGIDKIIKVGFLAAQNFTGFAPVEFFVFACFSHVFSGGFMV